MKVEIIANVFQTSDYDLFIRLEYNRIVTETRKNKLIASITIGDILCPIIVNKKMEIIDGQARFEARKQLGLPIIFVIDDDATIDDCRRMNSYNTKWTSTDYIRSYASAGNKNYIRLMEAMDETSLSLSVVMKLSCSSSRNRERVFDGSLNYTESDKETAIKYSVYAKKLIQELQLTKRVNNSFYTAVRVMEETSGFNEGRLLNKAAQCRSSFVMMAKLEDMLKEFSRIYNKGQSKERLYFEDYMRNKGSNVRDYGLSGVSLEAIDDLDISTLKRE